MRNILVSVAVPMYNVEQFAAECIESILNQTHDNLELFLVNDGSTDRTAEICKEYERKDSRVTFVDKENGGPTSCRLEGFRRAKGQYMYFADSDDVLCPELIAELLSACVQNEAEVSACGYKKFGGGSEPVFPVKSVSDVIEKTDFNTEIILPMLSQKAEDKTDIPSFYWNHLYKKDCLSEKCFISDKICTREDAYTNLKILDNINRIAVVDKNLYNYRVNMNSITVAYRENRLERDLYYINFIKNLLKEKNINNDDRLNALIYGAAYGNIDNFCKSGSFKIFKSGLNKMYQNEEINTAIKASLHAGISSAQKAAGELYLKKATLALYNFRKFVLKTKGIG